MHPPQLCAASVGKERQYPTKPCVVHSRLRCARIVRSCCLALPSAPPHPFANPALSLSSNLVPATSPSPTDACPIFDFLHHHFHLCWFSPRPHHRRHRSSLSTIALRQNPQSQSLLGIPRTPRPLYYLSPPVCTSTIDINARCAFSPSSYRNEASGQTHPQELTCSLHRQASPRTQPVREILQFRPTLIRVCRTSQRP